MKHIAVLFHKNDRPSTKSSRYFIDVFAGIWKEQGLNVSLIYGTDRYVEADLIVSHVNLTIVPDEYTEFMRRYPLAINASVKDVSKRRISSNRLFPWSRYQGAVIVKTNRNCRGGPESRLEVPQSWLEKQASCYYQKLFGDMAVGRLTDYPVYNSKREVPFMVWLDPGLVVEKFIPEMQDDYYCLRTWVFLGDCETSSICYSREPVVKSKNVIRREMLSGVPDELRRIRRELGFEFGKFDYAIVDGKVVLYDVNPTPALGGFSSDQLMPGMRILAEGIHALGRGRDGDGHWSKVAQLWRQVGAPLRPSTQDVEMLVSEVNAYAGEHGAPRALILGVTPELYHLPWPAGTKLMAVDRTPNMIKALWPGPASDAICSDWQEIPLEDSSRDMVLCDGGVHLLRYPDGQQAFVRTLRRIIVPGGLCLLRLFVPPRKRERAEDVLEDLHAGKVRDLNILKLRLGMSLLEDVTEGVALKNVWEKLHRSAPDFGELARKISWPLEHLLAIDTYRDSPNKYYFLPYEDVLRLFCEEPGGFLLERAYWPDYELGERCPTVVLRKLSDGGSS